MEKPYQIVPSRRAVDGNGVGEAHAGSDDEKVRRCRASVHRGLRAGEERGGEHFIEASRAKLKQLAERRLEKKKFSAPLVDAMAGPIQFAAAQAAGPER